MKCTLNVIIAPRLSIVVVLVVLCQGDVFQYSKKDSIDTALCNAQCTSWCLEYKNETVFGPGGCDLNKHLKDFTGCFNFCYDPLKYNCSGSCLPFPQISVDAPAIPEVLITNNAVNSQLVLKWSPQAESDENVVYIVTLVQTSQTGEIWTPLLEIYDQHDVTLGNSGDPCLSPDLRVSAVSSSGIGGFSHRVRTIVSKPGPARNVAVVSLDYQPKSYDNDLIYYSLQWEPDEGWSPQDVQYDVTVDAECPHNPFENVYIFNDDIQITNQGIYLLTGNIPTYIIGCTLVFNLRPISSCNVTIEESDQNVSVYRFTLSCADVDNYTGEYCGPRPELEPGPVRDVKVNLIHLTNRTLVMVTWLPPENLGSAGYVWTYHVTWGIVVASPPTPWLGPLSFSDVLGNTTLPGTVLGVDIEVNSELLPNGYDVGVMVRALGPGQVLNELMGVIYQDKRVWPEGQKTWILLDSDGTILAVQCRRPYPRLDTPETSQDTPRISPVTLSSHVDTPTYNGSSLDLGNQSFHIHQGATNLLSLSSEHEITIKASSRIIAREIGETNLSKTQYNNDPSLSGNARAHRSIKTPQSEEASRYADVVVYWRRNRLAVNASTTGYRIRWGDADYGCHGNISAMTFCGDQNVTSTSNDYLPLYNLTSNMTYGLQIKPSDDLSLTMDDDSDWSNVDLHTFTTLTLPYKTDEALVTMSTSTTLPTSTSVPTDNEINSNIKPTSSFQGPGSGNQSEMTILTIAVPSVLAVLLLCSLGGAIWHKRKRLRRQVIDFMDVPENRDYSFYTPDKSLNSTHSTSVVTDEWELPTSCLKCGPTLGSGAFGKVVKGRVSRALLAHRGVAPRLHDDGASSEDGDALQATVAVKMLQGDCEGVYRQDFLKEIQLMKKVGHHQNVVSMLGCCTLRDPVCLVVEHLGQGDLLNYLKAVRHSLQALPPEKRHYANCVVEVIDPLDLLRFAGHITRGMEFLASKGFVHRDLAARNVLVGSNKVCKIGDFGLARYVYDNAVYVNRRGGRLPVKWMSIEAIFDMTFSTASDVWSFGVVLFEIVTLGGTPYPTIPTKNLLKMLQKGYRMEKPENCSNQLQVYFFYFLFYFFILQKHEF